jgi:ABC-type transporter Mla MlaB component
MGVTLEQSEALNLLRLEGPVGISCAAEFKGLLSQALDSGCEVRVSLEGTTDLDVTAVQLLWAAERKARGAGVQYSIVDRPPEPVLAALSESGLQQFIFPVNDV